MNGVNYVENSTVKFGITELDKYPLCMNKNYCKQFIENDTLLLPCQKPDIECIDNLFVDVCIDDFKIIDTILGPKVIVEGIKKYKIIYTGDNEVQSVHSASFEEYFCQFILLDKFVRNMRNNNIKDIFIGIEDIVIKCYDCRSIEIALILIIYPIIIIDDECSYTSTKNHNVVKNNTSTNNITRRFSYKPK